MRRFFAFSAWLFAEIARFVAPFSADRASSYTYDGDGYGRLQEYELSSSCRPAVAGQESVPGGEEAVGSWRRFVPPSFGRGESGESLVRPDVVVPEAMGVEIGLRIVGNAGFLPPGRESLFESPEEAFDSSVPPRTEAIGSLMPHASERQNQSEQGRGKDGFVVGSEELRCSVAFESVEKDAKQIDGGRCPHPPKDESGTGTVVKDSEDLGVFVQEGGVPVPGDVCRSPLRGSVLEFLPKVEDGESAFLGEVGDVGLADGFAGVPVLAFEGGSDLSATGVRHEGAESYDRRRRPLGFLRFRCFDSGLGVMALRRTLLFRGAARVRR